MDERILPHQGARNSTVDQGYPSDGVFLLLHLWAPSKQNERLSIPSSRICAMVMNFLGEFLVGVCRHPVRELHRCPV
jgi:hypothetical protein